MALIIEIAAMLASVPLFIFGLALGDCLMLLWGGLTLYAGTALYCIRNRRSMKYAVIFLASWGLFMLGRVVVRLPEGVYLLAKFTEEEVVHTFQSLYLALAFFLLGLAALALICLAAWPRLPRAIRLAAGIAGGALLLWALWRFVFHTLF